MFIQVSHFLSRMEGTPCSHVTICEVCPESQVITGRYIIMRIAQVRDLEKEKQTLERQEQLNKQKIISRLDNKYISERSRSQSNIRKFDLQKFQNKKQSLRKSMLVFRQPDTESDSSDNESADFGIQQPEPEETTEHHSISIEKMKVSLLVDWVSTEQQESEAAQSLVRQRQLLDNFCRNISDI